MNDKVSIIVPVYNVKQYIKRCIDSLINQTYSNIEIIFVDDGSIDDGYKIINTYLQQDSRIVLKKQKCNYGVSNARNVGLSIATGEWICFCDADDWYDLDFVEKMLNCAKKENADYIICNYKIVTNQGTQVTVNNVRGLQTGCDKRNVIAFGPTSSCTHMIYSELFLKSKLKYPENCKQYEELPIIIALAKYATRIGVVNEPLYNYYQRGNQSSASNFSLNSEENFWISWKLLKIALGEGFEKELEYHAIYALLYGEVLNLCKLNKKKQVIKNKIKYYEKLFPNCYDNQYLCQLGKGKKIFLWCVHHNYIMVLRLLSWIHGKIVN